MSAQQIKVAIADDHKIFRDGIKMALRDRDYLKILWEAEDGRDLMHKLKIKQPDILLMDIRMPELDGINAIGLMRKEHENPADRRWPRAQGTSRRCFPASPSAARPAGRSY